MSTPRPQWAFELDCLGLGDAICVSNEELDILRWRRIFWRIRGVVLQRLFGWWRWQ